MNTYRHNKSGKLYELVQKNLLFKDKAEMLDDTFYEWRGKKEENLILYKALYDDTDGPFFVRHASDFYNNFTKVD